MVDINSKSNGTDALEQAVKNDRVEIVKFLLEIGANPNATYPDTTMPTILITAIKTPYAEHEKNLAIKEFLEHRSIDKQRWAETMEAIDSVRQIS